MLGGRRLSHGRRKDYLSAIWGCEYMYGKELRRKEDLKL